MSDFNAVSNSNEKTERAPAIQACIALSNFVFQSALCEISCPDMKFAWTINRVGQENVMSKIDRCYVSQEWLDDPELTLHLEVQPRTISDHNAILLYISKRRYNSWGRSPFRHFQYWQDMAGYSDLVCSAWTVDTRGCAMIKLIHKMEATRDKLKIWCNDEANNLPNQIMAMKTSIKFIQTQSKCDMSEAIEEECRLKHELSRLLWLEERLWRQKSRIKWLRGGDLNTKFFQGIANGRRRRNKIETITHEGRLATDSLEIFTACTDFFATLLGSTHGSGCLPQSIAPGPTVTSEENDELLKPINDTEIKWAVMEADRDSAPGPDGFGNSFFQSNWSVVQEAVGGAIRGFFNTNRLVKSVKTHIVFLPKEQGVTQVEKFQSISLCTSILKFITRIMVRRMRPVLNRIIAKNQNAFLSGRCIQDSFLLNQEIVHIFQNSKKKAACVKIDLSKAYDRVNWEFLQATLCYLGFHDLWVKKVMMIVTTVKSTLLINGKEGTWFENKRGLRQGDPLPPYLFITMMEMLTRSIQAQVNNNQIRIPTMGAGNTPPFSTLYANDIIFFIQGRIKNFRNLKACLDDFSSRSGLVINNAKSFILSFNLDSQVQIQIEQELGWHQGHLPSKYLGIPLQTIHVTKDQCRHLFLRTSLKLTLWKQKCLSFADRLSLIKHPLSMMSAYWSLMVKLPATTCKLLNKMAAEFLWGDTCKLLNKNHHRIKWATLCLPKLEGGVGLRDLSETNQANLAFLVYRMSQQSSPWAELVRGRYYERKALTDSSIRGKRVSKGDVCWKIGNGKLVKFWTDQWEASLLIDKIPTSHLHLICDTLGSTVNDIMGMNGDYISHFLARLNIPFTCPSLQEEQPDVMVWRCEDQRDFNRHKLWQKIRKKGPKNDDNMLVWKGRELPRATWTVYLASFGGTIIGKELSITKFVIGFALGSLGAMEASMMIDGLKSASFHGARAAKEEWQASLETSLFGPTPIQKLDCPGSATAGIGWNVGGTSLRCRRKSTPSRVEARVAIFPVIVITSSVIVRVRRSTLNLLAYERCIGIGLESMEIFHVVVAFKH
ncbi:retrotransposable element ORF2 protein [Nymphaea thermarum]|nr:retrotransposable element ORF2 protein [Nymphaea thermarum]